MKDMYTMMERDFDYTGQKGAYDTISDCGVDSDFSSEIPTVIRDLTAQIEKKGFISAMR